MTANAAQKYDLRWSGERPRVSVIMIFLNAERFIAEAIESVLAQDYGDLELILVDDGSAETCASLARSYTERFAPFVRYVQHEGGKNRGMSASRNLGLSHARGEFVAFLDADDVWARHKLREQLAIIEAHPEVDMVCGAVRYWRSWAGGDDVIIPSGHVQDRVVAPPEATLKLYPLGTAAAPCPSDLLIRCTAVAALGGFEEHFTGARQMYEDQGFLAKLYLSSPVYFSSQVWLSYRQHDDSCVADVTRNGQYHEVRRYFLDWFARYLASQPRRSRRVRAALYRASWRYAHPLLFRALDLGQTTAKRAGGVLRGRASRARRGH
jgi:glycosyltransferase involved in cell wall biosynthesis